MKPARSPAAYLPVRPGAMHAPSAGKGTATRIRLGYDARHVTDHSSGIGHMCLELLRGLADLPDSLTLDVIVHPSTPIPTNLLGLDHVRFHRTPWRPFSLASQATLPVWLWRHGIEVFHSVDSSLPIVSPRCRLVVNIHDVIPLTCSRLLALSRKSQMRSLWRAWLRLQCRCSARVVTGSLHALDDLVRVLGIDPGKVEVVANPIRRWNVVESPERLRHRLGLTGRVISYVGRPDPYKNLLTLIRAMPHLRPLVGPGQVQLVVVGKPDQRYPEAAREVERLGLTGHVLFPGYLDEASLGGLYQLSEAFVFPSLYEGFGMPPLEAMRFGTPVVAGRNSSLPEVLADAALYVDTTDPGNLARGVASVLNEPELSRRLGEAGLRHVARYSREQAARSYLRVYRELLHRENNEVGYFTADGDA